jgi:hypothetical protein
VTITDLVLVKLDAARVALREAKTAQEAHSIVQKFYISMADAERVAAKVVWMRALDHA